MQDGVTALFVAYNSFHVAQLLVDSGADVDHTDQVHSRFDIDHFLVAVCESATAVSSLAQRAIDLFWSLLLFQDGETPLIKAARFGFLAVVTVLVESGALQSGRYVS